MSLDTQRESQDDIVFDIDKPKKYKVLMHNDDYTTMEFVIDVLMVIFRKSEGEAVRLMHAIHEKGFAVCGIYAKEIAETKVEQVTQYARANDFPLKCTMEEE